MIFKINSSRKLVFILLFLLWAVNTLVARGTAEDAWRSVDGTDNWRHEQNIEENIPGLYNIIIRGTDYAGNEYIEGPFDIRIDPDSDLPVSRIMYPETGSITRGNMNIIGAAVDDDGISRVEVQLNEGPFQQAEGTEYWQYFLDTERLPDGVHRVTVRAYDINNLQGPEHSVSFILDTQPPDIEIRSHDSGAIVNGRVKFDGIVSDANGIDSLSLSRDGGETYEDIRFRTSKGDPDATFSFNVATDRLEDGPYIYWLRSIDKTGTKGETAFLFFVDNQSPQIGVLSPPEEAPVNGLVNVIGTVRDAVGIERFWYEWDKERVDIPLIPGNPYWSIQVDMRNIRGRTADLNLYAQDTSGNVTRLRHRMNNDQAGARPAVAITSPGDFDSRPVLESTTDIFGYVSGVTRAESVIVSGLGERGSGDREIPAYPGFMIPASEIPYGSADLRIRPKDELGITGDELRIRFVRKAPPPEVSISGLGYQDGTEAAFYPGMEFDQLRPAMIRGTISSPAAIRRTTVVIGSGNGEQVPRVRTARGNQPDETVFEITLPVSGGRGPFFGETPFTVTAEDEFGTNTHLASFIHYRDTRKMDAEPGIILTDHRKTGAGEIRLTGSLPLFGRVIGTTGGSRTEKIENIRLESADPENGGEETDLLRISVRNPQDSGDVFVIEALRPGTASGIMIRAESSEGITLEEGPFTFISETSAGAAGAAGGRPEILLESVTGAWAASPETGIPALQGFTLPAGERGEVRGTVVNGLDLTSLEYWVNQGEPSTVRTRAQDEDPSRKNFSMALPRDLSFGMHELHLRAGTADGGTALRRISFFVRASGEIPPYENQVLFHDTRITPDPGSGTDMIRFSELRELVGRFDGSPVSDVRIAVSGVDGDEGTEVLAAETGGDSHSIRLVPRGEGRLEEFFIVVTTRDGRVFTSHSYSAIVDTRVPDLVIDAPSSGEYFRETASLSGTIRNTGEVFSLEYRLQPDGPWRDIAVDEGGTFVIDIPLSAAGQSIGSGQGIGSGGYGPVHFFVRAAGILGHSVQTWIPVNYDSLDPVFKFITPPAQDEINGLTSVIAEIESWSPVTELSYSLDGENFIFLDPGSCLQHDVDFSLQPPEQPVIFRALNAAGGIGEGSPVVRVNLEADLPVVEIQIPAEGQVITSDFIISGMAFDDDGIESIFWRIGEGDFRELTGGNNFSVEVSLNELEDNVQLIEVYPVDVFGLQGETVERRIEVSLSDPVVSVSFPEVDRINRGTVTLLGSAEDANGVETVRISLDNGNTFHTAEGTEEWNFDLDTTAFTDGTYNVRVTAADRLGIEGHFFAILNIDNTPPRLDISLPAEGAHIAGEMVINGLVGDNGQVAALILEIEPINREHETVRSELATGRIVQETVDISALEEGWYNVRLTAYDGAENLTRVSRNIFVQDSVESSFVSLLFPMQGTVLRGPVAVEGRARSMEKGRRGDLSVGILVNGSLAGLATVNQGGYFRYDISGEIFNEDPEVRNTVQAFIESADERVYSGEHSFFWQSLGPDVKITSHNAGDFLTNRPWISGEAVYYHNIVPETKEQTAMVKSLEVREVWVSLDNGITMEKARGTGDWRYRLETREVPDGPINVLVQAVFRNGETAVTRSLFTVDKNPPRITLLSPEEGSRINTMLVMEGSAADEHGIESIQIALREGSKSKYAVPEFIQGMYFDTHFLGLTYFDVGMGLSFFDDNVKLQLQFGVGPAEDRFAGTYLGGKLLANIANVPFSAFFGPDFEWLSMTFAVGANFSYIMLYDPLLGGEGAESVVLSGIVAQLEFPRVHLANRSLFHTYSFYTEPQLWFIPSDVAPALIPRLSFGIRIGIF